MGKKYEVSEAAMELHRASVVMDLHADTPSLMRAGYDIFRPHRPWLPAAAFGIHLDVPRMEKGGLNAQLFGLVTFPLSRRGQYDSAVRQIELVKKAAAERPDRFRFVTEADEIEQAKKDGAAAALCSMEGAHGLEGSLDNLRRLARMGMRALGLLHFTENPAGYPAAGKGSSKTEGLKPFGRELIGACNEMGLIVDLAHLNRPGFMEAAGLCKDPVIVSHTGLAGVRPLWRNIDDEQVRTVADSGGCIGLIFSGYFLGRRTLDALIDHIVHCMEVGGEDCPALGSDFDGLIVPPKELPDVTALPRMSAVTSGQ